MDYNSFEELVKYLLAHSDTTLTPEEQEDCIQGHWKIIDTQYKKARTSYEDDGNPEIFIKVGLTTLDELIVLSE